MSKAMTVVVEAILAIGIIITLLFVGFPYLFPQSSVYLRSLMVDNTSGFVAYESQLTPDEKKVEASMDALVFAINSVADKSVPAEKKTFLTYNNKEDKDDKKTSTIEVACTPGSSSLTLTADTSDMVLAKAITDCWNANQGAEEDILCMELSPQSMGLSLVPETFTSKVDKSILVRIGGEFYEEFGNNQPTCIAYRQGTVYLGRCSPDYKQQQPSCRVTAFQLPQAGTQSTLRDLVPGYGDPQYLVYYEAFPDEEDVAWQINPMSMVIKAAVIRGFINMIPLGGKGGSAALKEGLKSKAKQKVVRETTAELTGRPIQKLLKKTIETGTEEGAQAIAKKRIIAEVISSGSLRKTLKEGEINKLAEAFEAAHTAWSSKAGTMLVDESGALTAQGWAKMKGEVIEPFLRKQGYGAKEAEKIVAQFEKSGFAEAPLNKIGKEIADEALKRANFRNVVIASMIKSNVELDKKAMRESLLKAKTVLESLPSSSHKAMLERAGQSATGFVDEAGELNLALLASESPSSWLRHLPSSYASSLKQQFMYGIGENAGTLSIIGQFVEKAGANLWKGATGGPATPVAWSWNPLKMIVKTPFKAVSWAANKPYSVGIALAIYSEYMDSINEKKVPVGVNTVSIIQPMFISPKKDFTLSESAKPYYVELEKTANNRDGTRLYLGSPCKADLIVEKTSCSCLDTRDPLSLDTVSTSAGKQQVKKGTLVYKKEALGGSRADNALIVSSPLPPLDNLRKYHSGAAAKMFSESINDYNTLFDAYGRRDDFDSLFTTAEKEFLAKASASIPLEKSCTDYALSLTATTSFAEHFAAGYCFEREKEYDPAIPEYYLAISKPEELPLPGDALPADYKTKYNLEQYQYTSKLLDVDGIGAVRIPLLGWSSTSHTYILFDAGKQKNIDQYDIYSLRIVGSNGINYPYTVERVSDEDYTVTFKRFIENDLNPALAEGENGNKDITITMYMKQKSTVPSNALAAQFRIAEIYFEQKEYGRAARTFEAVVEAAPESWWGHQASDALDAIIVDPEIRKELDKANYPYLVSRYSADERKKFTKDEVPNQGIGEFFEDTTAEKIQVAIGWTRDEVWDYMHHMDEESAGLYNDYLPFYATETLGGKPLTQLQFMDAYGSDNPYFANVPRHLLYQKQNYLGTTVPSITTPVSYQLVVDYQRKLEADTTYSDDVFEQLMIKKQYYEKQLSTATQRYSQDSERMVFFKEQLEKINKELQPAAEDSMAIRECPKGSWWTDAKGAFSESTEYKIDCITVSVAKRYDDTSPNYCHSEPHPLLSAALYTLEGTFFVVDLGTQGTPFGAPVRFLTGASVAAAEGIASSWTKWPNP